MRAAVAAGLLVAGTAWAGPTAAPQVWHVRPDTRLCPSVACGGWWVHAVNRAQSTCADGTKAKWCYVAEIDWTGGGWTAQEVADWQAASSGGVQLVAGRLDLRSYGAAGDFGVLVPGTAFVEFLP